MTQKCKQSINLNYILTNNPYLNLSGAEAGPLQENYAIMVGTDALAPTNHHQWFWNRHILHHIPIKTQRGLMSY